MTYSHAETQNREHPHTNKPTDLAKHDDDPGEVAAAVAAGEGHNTAERAGLGKGQWCRM